MSGIGLDIVAVGDFHDNGTTDASDIKFLLWYSLADELCVGFC
jgi:hypothetical protein